MKLTEYQALLDRIKSVEDTIKEREKHILQLEARLRETETSVNEVKAECSNVAESINYSQREQDDLKERMSLCENELSAQGDEISKQSVYSRRWNLVFYRILPISNFQLRHFYKLFTIFSRKFSLVVIFHSLVVIFHSSVVIFATVQW